MYTSSREYISLTRVEASITVKTVDRSDCFYSFALPLLLPVSLSWSFHVPIMAAFSFKPDFKRSKIAEIRLALQVPRQRAQQMSTALGV